MWTQFFFCLILSTLTKKVGVKSKINIFSHVGCNVCVYKLHMKWVNLTVPSTKLEAKSIKHNFKILKILFVLCRDYCCFWWKHQIGRQVMISKSHPTDLTDLCTKQLSNLLMIYGINFRKQWCDESNQHHKI